MNNSLIIDYLMMKQLPIGYSINIKNEPYITDNSYSIITPTRLLISIKYKNQIIKRYYLSIGINASRENIIQTINRISIL